MQQNYNVIVISSYGITYHLNLNLNLNFHRTDGPAMEAPGGKNVWYLNGNVYSKEEFETYKKTLILR